MNIVADCGSTKCDWLIIHGQRNQQLENTVGFSPFFHTTSDIEQIVRGELLPKMPSGAVENVWFYGTGVHNAERAEIIAAALRKTFPGANIEVWHDLLASARACCQRSAGIACILGTGSNSCYYDGERVVDNVPSLGWLLGDEGSGTHLGKALLRAFFYRELPADLLDAFNEAYPEGGSAIKDRVYEKGANAYLASFTRFLGDHIQHPFTQKLVATSFGEFLDRQACKYPGHQSVPLHFVGSIAHHFRDVLKKCMDERRLELGTIIRKPIYPLADYHMPNAEQI